MLARLVAIYHPKLNLPTRGAGVQYRRTPVWKVITFKILRTRDRESTVRSTTPYPQHQSLITPLPLTFTISRDYGVWTLRLPTSGSAVLVPRESSVLKK